MSTGFRTCFLAFPGAKPDHQCFVRRGSGIENFKEMIDKNAYYVDKTNLIIDVLNEQVVFCTRPRRFGKTLNMSMLYYFFSIKEKDNAYLII